MPARAMAGQATMEPTGPGADSDSGLGILDAPVVPTQRAGNAPSDQTEVFPSVPSQGDPAEVGASPSRPVATQQTPAAAQTSPITPQANSTAAQVSPNTAQARPAAAQASLTAAPESPTAAWPPSAGSSQAMPLPSAPQPVGHHQGQQLPPAPYPGQQYHHQVQDAYRPTYTDEGGSTGRNRAALIGAVVAAGVAVVAVAGLGAVMLTRDDAPPTGTAPTAAAQAPTAAGPAPGDLKLRDDSTTVTLTWTDPTGGAVPFMVAAGRAGQPLGVIATVDPGRTSHTVNGLNSRVDHCFTVLAVYSTDSFATSGQVCTTRERTASSSGSPSGRPSPR